MLKQKAISEEDGQGGITLSINTIFELKAQHKQNPERYRVHRTLHCAAVAVPFS